MKKQSLVLFFICPLVYLSSCQNVDVTSSNADPYEAIYVGDDGIKSIKESRIDKRRQVAVELYDGYEIYSLDASIENLDIQNTTNGFSFEMPEQDVSIQITTSYESIPTAILQSVNHLGELSFQEEINVSMSSLSPMTYVSLMTPEYVKTQATIRNFYSTTQNSSYYTKDSFGFAQKTYLDATNNIVNEPFYGSDLQRVRFDDFSSSPFSNVFSDHGNPSFVYDLFYFELNGDGTWTLSAKEEELISDSLQFGKLGVSLMNMTSFVPSYISNVTGISLTGISIANPSLQLTYDEKGQYVKGVASYNVLTSSLQADYQNISVSFDITTLSGSIEEKGVENLQPLEAKEENAKLQESLSSGLLKRLGQGNYTMKTEYYQKPEPDLTKDKPDATYNTFVDLPNDRFISDGVGDFDGQSGFLAMVKSQNGETLGNYFITAFDKNSTYIGYVSNFTDIEKVQTNFSRISKDFFQKEGNDTFTFKIDRTKSYLSDDFIASLKSTLLPGTDTEISPIFGRNNFYDIDSVSFALHQDTIVETIKLGGFDEKGEKTNGSVAVITYSHIGSTVFTEGQKNILNDLQTTVESLTKS